MHLDLSDEQLMGRVKNGQLEQVNALFERYGRRLYAYFLKSTMSKDDSDDLTQDLFVRVMKYRKSYKEGQRFELWVFQIARNMVKDHFKKMKVHDDYFRPEEMIPDLEDHDDREQADREKKLYEAMKKLSEEKRELLVMSKFDGMKYDQLAALRKTSVSNIKVQVHRTIKELKEIYFQLN